MTPEGVTLDYYYKKVPYGILEKHIDVISEEILDNDTHTGKIGDPYKIDPKEFPNYDLVTTRLPENAEGTFGNGVTEVKYYYLHTGKVIAKYQTEEGTSLADDVEYPGHEGDSYTTMNW